MAGTWVAGTWVAGTGRGVRGGTFQGDGRQPGRHFPAAPAAGGPAITGGPSGLAPEPECDDDAAEVPLVYQGEVMHQHQALVPERPWRQQR